MDYIVGRFIFHNIEGVLNEEYFETEVVTTYFELQWKPMEKI